MIYRGELYYGPEKKTLFVVYGSYENVGKALGLADMSLSDEEYPYRTCSHHPLLKYWALTAYYAVLEWVLRKLGKWNDSGVEVED